MKLEGITVLSLFNGMSCGYMALDKLGVKVKKYYSSEIDKHAIKASKLCFPDIVELGDVTKWESWDIDLSEIDIVIAGSPCQGFSFAGKQLAFDDPRSVLFFEFVKIYNHVKSFNPDVLFFLENVKMKKEHELVISRYMGVAPIEINSSLLSAQNRQRLYWTSIANKPFGLFGDMECTIPQPKDKGINFGFIRENNVNSKYYYTQKGLKWINNHSLRKNKELRIFENNSKVQMIETSHHKKYSSQRFFAIKDTDGLRYITPRECGRAQTIPEDILEKMLNSGISDTQLYRMFGNGWTVDVIAYIFSFANFNKT